MIDQISRSSRANRPTCRNTGFQPVHCPPDSQDGCVTGPLRHLRHPLAIQVNFADAFDARQHVINCLTANADQFGTNDARYEVAWKIEDLLWRAALQAFAKDRGHRAGERLHFGPERHADVRFAVFIDMQINADGVHAFLVFADIDKIKTLTFARLLLLRIVRVGDERLPPLIFWQRLEEIYDLVELDRIRAVRTDLGGTRLI